MSCTILYYILSLCLHVLSMGLKHLKYNFFIFIFITGTGNAFLRLEEKRFCNT